MAWACEDWIELAIEQGLELVDELIIAIGAFHPYFKKIEDRTYMKAKKYFNNKKIKIVETLCNPKNNADQNRAATANYILKESGLIEVGDVVWTLDADEFYSKEAIREIGEYIKNNDFEEIYVKDRMFCINFNYYIDFEHARLLKIKDYHTHFKPPQRIYPRPKEKVVILEKNPMFHYSMLMGEQMKGIQWMLEGISQAVIWYKKIYNNYDPENETLWLKKNQELTGNYRFWRDDHKGIEEKNGHGFFRYDGKHPEIIERSPLRNISDFREYMKNKPNYPAYLAAMRQLINEKKRFDYKILLLKISESELWQRLFLRFKERLIRIRLMKKIFGKLQKYMEN